MVNVHRRNGCVRRRAEVARVMNRSRLSPAVSSVCLATALLAPCAAHADDATDAAWPGAIHRSPHLLRAGLEMTGFLAIGATWYWLNKEVNSADWEYSTFSSRLTLDAIRFDNNSFATNHLLHTGAGAAYHAFARANGLPLWASALSTFATSTLWEGVLEFKERVSINDEVFTTVGGVALGETWFQLGDYLQSAPDGGGGWHRAAAWTFGFPVALHDAIDGRVSGAGPTDALGFSARFWHRFELDLESTRLTSDGARFVRSQGLRLSASIVNLPGYLSARRMRKAFWSGNFTDLRFRLAREGATLGEIDVLASTTLFGIHHQDLDGPPDDLQGVAATLGVSIGFEHMQRHGLGPHDRIALVRLPGLSMSLQQAFGGERWLRLRADAHPEFAAMHALAWPIWREAHPNVHTKSVLVDQEYAYYAGVATSLIATFEWGGFELGGYGRYGFYDSIEGLDREQDLMEVDVQTEEDLIEHHLWVGWNFRSPAIQLRVSLEDLLRRGRAEEFDVDARDTRGIAAVGYVF